MKFLSEHWIFITKELLFQLLHLDKDQPFGVYDDNDDKICDLVINDISIFYDPRTDKVTTNLRKLKPIIKEKNPDKVKDDFIFVDENDNPISEETNFFKAVIEKSSFILFIKFLNHQEDSPESINAIENSPLNPSADIVRQNNSKQQSASNGLGKEPIYVYDNDTGKILDDCNPSSLGFEKLVETLLSEGYVFVDANGNATNDPNAGLGEQVGKKVLYVLHH